MMNSRTLTVAVSALITLVLATGSPATAQSSPGAAAGSFASVTVPIFGTSMVVTINLDSEGDYVSANLVPTAPAALVAPEVVMEATPDDNPSDLSEQTGVFEVRFDHDSTEVRVRPDDGPAIGVDGAVAPIAGDSQWVGDPLGNGDIVVVGYSLGTDAGGTPTIEINSINGTIPADTQVVASAGEFTWYQVLVPTFNGGHLVQFITFFDAPTDPDTQVSTNLTFDISTVGGVNDLSVSLTDPNSASTINGTATPRGDDDDDHDDDDDEYEDDDDDDDDEHEDDD